MLQQRGWWVFYGLIGVLLLFGAEEHTSSNSGDPFPEVEPLPKAVVLNYPAPGSVSLNAAGIKELQRIPGIGPSTAARIIDYRQCMGPFSAVAELQAVHGIGPATLQKIEGFFCIDSQAIHLHRRVLRLNCKPFALPRNLNTLSAKSLYQHHLLPRPVARQLIKQRTRQNGFRNWGQVHAALGYHDDLLWNLLLNTYLGEANLEQIDINYASAQELQALEGIGPALSERIVSFRRRVGRFATVEQLQDVKGIGKKTLAKNRARIFASRPADFPNLLTAPEAFLRSFPYLSAEQAERILELREGKSALCEAQLRANNTFHTRDLKQLAPYLPYRRCEPYE